MWLCAAHEKWRQRQGISRCPSSPPLPSPFSLRQATKVSPLLLLLLLLLPHASSVFAFRALFLLLSSSFPCALTQVCQRLRTEEGGSYVRRRPQRISQHQHPSLRLPLLRLLKWAFRTRKEGRKRGRWELDHQFRRRRPSNAGVFGRWLSGKGRPAEVFLAGILAKGEGEEGRLLSGYFPLAECCPFLSKDTDRLSVFHPIAKNNTDTQHLDVGRNFFGARSSESLKEENYFLFLRSCLSLLYSSLPIYTLPSISLTKASRLAPVRPSVRPPFPSSPSARRPSHCEN